MIQDFIPNYLLYFYYGAIALLIFSIVLDNRNPSKTTGYVLLLIFVPIVGVLIYFYFGRNYRKRKLFNRKGFTDNLLLLRWKKERETLFDEQEKSIESDSGEAYPVIKLLQNNNALLTHNNYVKLLTNGEEKFEDLIESIRNASHHIHLEYYIIEEDPLTRKLFDALIEKEKAEVEVRIIYDGVGSKLSNSFLRKIKNAGIEIHPFMPVRFPYFTSNANYRDHRKIVVIDGNVGYLGGINLSNRYLNNGENTTFWRDTHLRLDGECVRQLQIQFMLMWKFVSGEKLPIQIRYFPLLPLYTQAPIQVAFSGPDSDWASIMLAFFKAISVAKKEILITTPYFIPNEQILTAIQAAALSGIDVKILIPKKSDSKFVQSAMMSFTKELLSSGARVFLYKKGFIHAKTMVIDDVLSTVGTTNMDLRSFNINFETNAFIYNTEVCKQLKEQFNTDLLEAEELTLSRWEKRPITKRIIESTARLFAPVL